MSDKNFFVLPAFTCKIRYRGCTSSRGIFYTFFSQLASAIVSLALIDDLPIRLGAPEVQKNKILAMVRSKLGAAIAVAGTLVLAPLLTFSETTIKGIMDRWLSQCVVVVESQLGGDGAILVRLHTFGDMPKTLPITVVAKTGKVDRVTLLNHVEENAAGNESNILVHPLANQRCPGALCEEQPVAAERLTVRITPMSPNYLYQLRVLTSDVLGYQDLSTYVRPLKGESIACRVERATLANFVARQSREIQLLILFSGVVVIMLLIAFLRRKPEEINDGAISARQ